MSIPAEQALQRVERVNAQFSDRAHSKLGEPLFRDLANSRDAANRQRSQEVLNLGRLDDKKPIRLAPIGGNFCEEFVGSRAGGGGQVKFLTNLLPDHARHFRRRGKAGLVLSDIEIRLIERQWLDKIRMTKEDFAHGTRDCSVTHEVGRGKDARRSSPP